jgi:hypothetical protein
VPPTIKQKAIICHSDGELEQIAIGMGLGVKEQHGGWNSQIKGSGWEGAGLNAHNS